MFQVDARACGKGKTVKGIYVLIKRLLSQSEKILLIVPSIDLQYQYQEKFKHQIYIINSNECTETTTQKLSHAMYTHKKFICITRQTFLLSYGLTHKHHYHLIIDESLDNLYMELDVPVYDKNKLVQYNWQEHFSISHEPEDDKKNNVFYPFNLGGYSDDAISNASWHYKKIINQNYNWFISPYDYGIMTGNTSNKKSFKLYGIATKEILENWLSVYCAAAAFETTSMYWWFNYHRYEFSYIENGEFQPHQFNNHHLHYGDFKLWSKSKQITQSGDIDSIELQHVEYAKNIIQNNDVISLRNWETKKAKFANEIRVNHNIHGMNNPRLANCSFVSVESALNPSKQYFAFMSEIFLKNVTNKDKDMIIRQMFSGNLIYQIIMRSVLRSSDYSGQDVHTFLMDQITCNMMDYYFTNHQLHPIPIVVNSTKNKDKLVKKQQQLANLMADTHGRAMTENERKYKCKLLIGINKLKNSFIK